MDAIRDQDKSAVEAWSRKEHWQTVHQLMQAQGPMRNGNVDSAMDASPLGGASEWQCAHCTYLNNSAFSSCEICGLPRN